MKLITILFISLFLIAQVGMGQTADSSIIITTANTNNEPRLDTHLTNKTVNFKKRLRLVTSLQGLGYGASMVGLNKIWYAGYPKSSFHYYNDAGEWLDMDKVGHVYTAYSLSRLSFRTWEWAGVPHKKAVLLAGFSGLAYQTVIETLDGFSTQWGWSWSDIGSNTIGVGLWMGQELLWKKQRVRLKFSAHYNKYNDKQLQDRTNNFFGSVFTERLFKDYNAQTYWLSANIHDFNNQVPVPKWLNIAVGYGADNMFGGYGNSWPSPNGDIVRNDIKRYKQWYLSLDVDFEKIPTKKKWVKSMFFVLNAIKFPAPTLMLSNGKWSSQWLYY
jgi:hypothetical protein